MNYLSATNILSARILKKAAKINPTGIYRLAAFLKLNSKNMSPKQTAELIRWRITRPDMKYRI